LRNITRRKNEDNSFGILEESDNESESGGQTSRKSQNQLLSKHAKMVK